MATAKLTPKELDLMTAVVTSGEVQVADWASVAKAANMSTAKYARDTWTVIKKKLVAGSKTSKASGGANEGPAAAAAATALPSSPAVEEDKDAEAPASTPKSRKKATPRSSRKNKKPDDDDDDYERPLKKTGKTDTTLFSTPAKKKPSAKSAPASDEAEGETTKSDHGEDDAGAAATAADAADAEDEYDMVEA